MLTRPPRDTRMDLLRGALQLQIFASHAHGSLIGLWLITSAWGLSDSSEQFIYLSGFALGSVFALKASRGGWGPAAIDLLRRAARLYRTHLIVLCGFAAMVLSTEMAAHLPGEARAMGWGWLLDAPWFALPAAASLLWQPEFMGILPLFVFCMLGLPAFAWAEARWGAWALLPSGALYAAVHLWGWHIPGLGGLEVEFNPLAWQFLYMIGAYFGRRALVQGRAIGVYPPLVAAAALVLAFGLWVRLVGHGILPGPAFDLLEIADKQHLSPLRLLHALALAYIIVVVFGRRDVALPGLAAQALAAAGRHSLQVFCIGLFLSYGVATIFRLHPQEALWLDAPLVLGGMLALLAFAWAAERRQATQAA